MVAAGQAAGLEVRQEAAPGVADIAEQADVGPSPVWRGAVGLALGAALGLLGVVAVPRREAREDAA